LNKELKEAIKYKLGDARATLEAMEEEINGMGKQVNYNDQRLDRMEGEIKGMQEYLTTVEDSLQELQPLEGKSKTEQRIDKLEKEIEFAHTRLDTLSSLVKKLKEGGV